MDTPFIEWIVGQAGISGLAAVSLYLLNRSHQDSVRREREHADTNRADKLELMRIIMDTTRAISALEKAIDAIADRYSQRE